MRNLQIETITTATGKQDVIRDIETVNAILKDNAQLEASLNEAITELKHVDTILLRRPSLCLLPRQNQIEKAIEDIGKLEASLRLAVEKLDSGQQIIFEGSHHYAIPIENVDDTLSTIRAKHPNLEERK
jgi:hypothetical protein